jgi:Tfp pilus assembly protein PilX
VTRHRREERGAALILAIAFMVVIAAVSGAVLSMLTSGLSSRVALDDARDREYAADGAIQAAISQTYVAANGSGHVIPGQPCLAIPDHTINNDGHDVTIHTDCASAPAVTRDLIRQLNAVFTTCEANKVPSTPPLVCPASSVIIRAQVNFQATGAGADLHVQRTWVQAWSVNG